MRQPTVDQLSLDLRAIVGREGVLTESDELIVYECDGLPQHKFRPRAVVFPRSTEEVSEVLKLLARERVPFSPRGAGTGLSGGALALERGVTIELARMRALLKLDPENRLALVQTGMVNAHLSRAAAPYGLHYVPDPSSQMTCTIGGNIAENAGGIHCLKYGTTVDHVLAARVVLGGGEIVDLDLNSPGYDLLGLFIGSEGTFGIATEATLRLTPIPPAVRTLLAIFEDVNDASRAVSAIIAAGLMPAGLEMMDGAIIRAVEASVFAAGLPTDAEAALLIELDGLEAGLDEDVERAEKICLESRAREVRRAVDEAERKKLWAARKGAFGAMGRISPDTMLQDAVVPRSRLPEVLAATYRIGAKYGLRVANVFHAGDGNLHPFLCFDARHAEEVRRVKEAGRELMETCVRAGGSITGEHGVGLDKSAYLPLIFSDDDMDVMLRVRAAFDPTGLCNPGKIIPTSRSCGEARSSRQTSRQTGEAARSFDEEAGSEKPDASSSVQEEEQRQQVSDEKRKLKSSTAQSHPSHVAGRGDRHALLSGIVGAEHVSESGLMEALAVEPASAVEACEVLRLASLERWTILPSGAGTWLEAGRGLSRVDLFLGTRRMKSILEHEPADLIATTEAGLTLAALNTELARAGQWLPLDPPDNGRASVGGVVAAGLAGAQKFGYGGPRGSVIGMRVALADGRMLKAGGRVVKNVAGYDLCKLLTGSRGTLGLIVELTFKLRPLPAQTSTIIAQAPLASLLRSARAVLAARLFPVAIEILSPRATGRVFPSTKKTGCALLLRFAGTSQAVEYQLAQTQAQLARETQPEFVEVVIDDARLWRDVAALPFQHQHELAWQAHLLPTRLEAFLSALDQDEGAAFPSALWQACAGDGRVRFISQRGDAERTVAALASLSESARVAGGTFFIERTPAEIHRACAAISDTGAPVALMQRIKKQLDPENIFSPGRLFAAI
ncbi:MAG TPA: FAD-linked oxidase C-terminal domain-containing protein [Pyrinomonadaceae bacterium]|jgi:glycolate oxidase subunit GlcD